METLSGKKIKANFDPQLIADFQTLWNETHHRQWEPIYKKDLNLSRPYDFFEIIVNRVRRFNESYDMTIVGDRGLGKSAFGLGAAQIINRYYNEDSKAQFSLAQVCFDVDSWITATDDLVGTGGVVILDEVGTEGSLSSRTSMSKENRTTADIVQLCRTDRIITIYITTDRDRIDKRVRQLTSVMGTPLAKLTGKQTNGYGLAIEADIRYRRTKPAGDNYHKQRSENDSGYLMHEVSPLHFAPKGRIYSIVVPHPTVELWQGYEAKRAQKLAEVREAGFLAQEELEDIPEE